LDYINDIILPVVGVEGANNWSWISIYWMTETSRMRKRTKKIFRPTTRPSHGLQSTSRATYLP